MVYRVQYFPADRGSALATPVAFIGCSFGASGMAGFGFGPWPKIPGSAGFSLMPPFLERLRRLFSRHGGAALNVLVAAVRRHLVAECAAALGSVLLVLKIRCTAPHKTSQDARPRSK